MDDSDSIEGQGANRLLNRELQGREPENDPQKANGQDMQCLYRANPEGDVLQLFRIAEYEENVEPGVLRTVGFDVYKVRHEKNNIEPVDSLGDNAFFVGTSCSTCLSVKEYPHLLPNHTYFDDDNEYWLQNKGGRRDVGVYNDEKDTVTDT